MRKAKLYLISSKCVNSKWVADWLSKENQECCQCIVGCKVKIRYSGYEFIVTQSEYELLNTEQEVQASVASKV